MTKAGPVVSISKVLTIAGFRNLVIRNLVIQVSTNWRPRVQGCEARGAPWGPSLRPCHQHSSCHHPLAILGHLCKLRCRALSQGRPSGLGTKLSRLLRPTHQSTLVSASILFCTYASTMHQTFPGLVSGHVRMHSFRDPYQLGLMLTVGLHYQ